MRRIPVTFRALTLVPLLALAVDQVRVSAFCGASSQSCLEAAGSGPLGPRGAAVRGADARVLALGVARAATARGAVRLWPVSSVGLLAVLGGQAALAAALGDPSALGGGWLEVLPLCLLAGAALGLALRVVPAAVKLLKRLRPAAPRLRGPAVLTREWPELAARSFSPVRALTAAGRAPPSPVG
jgi:hypothetical protein